MRRSVFPTSATVHPKLTSSGVGGAITVDFGTLEDDAVTVRERDSMSQERIALSQVEAFLATQLIGG